MKGKFTFISSQNAEESSMNFGNLLKITTVMKMIIITFVLLLSALNLSAQKQFNNWYFGEKAGITFNTPTGEPEALLDGELSTYEGCSTISDSNGKLLFYTDGITVWNRLHKVMKNGSNLFGHMSSSQSAIIVPKPKSDSIYYIFTNDAAENFYKKGFNYSVVDMSLDNGRGSVIQKNVFLLKNNCESVAAISRINGDFVWILTKDIDKRQFVAYLLTENGINTNPVISPFADNDTINNYSMLKFSPRGNKVVTNNIVDNQGCIFLYDSNPESGLIKNEIIIKSKIITNCSIRTSEFSVNGKFLFFTSYDLNTQIYYLHQVDISSNISDEIIKSEKIIYQFDDKKNPGILQLGPNNRIYLAVWFNEDISVINNPDLSGNDCNFKHLDCNLNGRKSMFSLPSVVQYYLSYNYPQDTISICENDSVFLFSPYYENAEYQWTGPNGFTSTVHKPVIPNSNLSMRGEYSFVVNQDGGTIATGTIYVEINPREKILFSDIKEISICEESLELRAVENPEKCDITWAGIDSKENTVIIRESGIYTVYVQNEFGCMDSASIYIYKFGEKISIYEKQHDFGSVKAGTLSEFSFTIENKESSDITVTGILVKNEPVHFELLHNELPLVVKSNEKAEIKVNFIPKYDINIADSVVVIFSNPCDITEYVKLSGTGYGDILVDLWLPDTTADIGSTNYLLPINVQLRDKSNYSFKTNITARIKFLRTIYNVESLSYGQFTDEKLNDSVTFNIELIDVLISDELNNISDFVGQILFTTEGFTKVVIENLEFNNPFLIPVARDGSIKINEICNHSLNGITIRGGTFLSQKYDRIHGNFAIAYCGSAGNYKLSIYTIAGEMLYSTNWNTASKTEKHFDLSGIISNSGMYFIVLNSADGIDLQKVTLIK